MIYVSVCHLTGSEQSAQAVQTDNLPSRAQDVLIQRSLSHFSFLCCYLDIKIHDMFVVLTCEVLWQRLYDGMTVNINV